MTSGPRRIGRTTSVPSTARREKGYSIGEDPFDLIFLADVGYLRDRPAARAFNLVTAEPLDPWYQTLS